MAGSRGTEACSTSDNRCQFSLLAVGMRPAKLAREDLSSTPEARQAVCELNTQVPEV